MRTFCTPDSVLRKQMHDVYRILEMLGAPLVAFLAFQEIQVGALGVMRGRERERERERMVGKGRVFGVERRWEPEGEVEGWENPFP